MKKKTGTSKAFNCVAFKRQAQKDIYQAIKNMTPAQEIVYFEKQAAEGSLGDWWKQVKAAGNAASEHAVHKIRPR
jgi:hypothetical protein